MYYLTTLTLLLGLLSSPTARVTVAVSSTAAGGELRLAVFDGAEAFTNDAPLLGTTEVLTGTTTSLSIAIPRPGTYVFAAFQDLNGNGRLDRNFLGVPTEPYGFTRTPASKWRTPNFTEVASEVGDGGDTLRLELRRWREY